MSDTLVVGPSSAPRPAKGTVVDHYEFVAPIGRGGYGEVWRAIDLRLRRPVAIKSLSGEVGQDQLRRERLRREALAASSLHHANICTIHDLVETKEAPFLVMEYVEGETLQERLRRGPLPLRDAIPIAIQIAEALSEAHRHGIVHRDIKPANVMITHAGQVKVLDFGIARATERRDGHDATTELQLTAPGAAIGTLHYMSPEQLLGGDVDSRTDLFSFGVVLYEMLTGRRPFDGSSYATISDGVLHAEPTAPSTISSLPRDVDRILLRLLAKDCEKRYGTADELLADLRPLAAPAARRSSVMRVAAIAAVSAVLLIAAAFIPLAMKWRREQWARETLVPKIESLIEREQFAEAVRLARTAKVILPDDRRLASLWPKMTIPITADSVPPGASVSFARYDAPESQWEVIGRTPLKAVPVPRGLMYRWKIEKEGYVTAFRVGPWLPQRWTVNAVLDRVGAPPHDMIRMPGRRYRLSIPGLAHIAPVDLSAYFIDAFEVTNEEYKKFVDAGGYGNPAFWSEPFVRGSKAVPFAQAMQSFVDTTGRPGPATWELGSYPSGHARHPVAGVSWYEAAAYARFAGKRLPTVFHWSGASGGEFSRVIAPASNFEGRGASRVGSRRNPSSFGLFDTAGNVKEWCSNAADGEKRYILGGGWNEPSYMAVDQDAQDAWGRLPTYGFRCIRSLGPVPPEAERAISIPLRDYRKEKPVSDEVFNAYRSLYEYDRTALNAVVESTDSSPETWTVQKVSFDAAYGGERVIAYLFLPKNARPPYQTVIFFPGSGALHTQSVGNVLSRHSDFVPAAGRALVLPVYKGTYERRDMLTSDYPELTATYREHVIAWAKDLRRCIDYLETRPDIDSEHLALLGASWGGAIGPIMAALEPRLKTVILIAGGFFFQRALPEADQINFTPRMKQPVLLLDARFDHFFPVESSQIPFVQSIGTAPQDKKYVVYDSGHALPRTEVMKEAVAWLDRYLGPVKR